MKYKNKQNIIVCGDCLKELETMPDNHVDLVFTSPPHNRLRNDNYLFYNDTIKEYYNFLLKAINTALRISKNIVIFNIQKNSYNKKDVYKIIGHYNNLIYDIIYHCKSNPTPSRHGIITNATEMFIILSKNGKVNVNIKMMNYFITSVVSNKNKDHRAVMRQDVAEMFIKAFSNQNDIVLDMFGGTGTTLKACNKLNRKCIIIEKVEQYYKMILNVSRETLR